MARKALDTMIQGESGRFPSRYIARQGSERQAPFCERRKEENGRRFWDEAVPGGIDFLVRGGETASRKKGVLYVAKENVGFGRNLPCDLFLAFTGRGTGGRGRLASAV